jgi:hypothetical protein
LRPLQVGDLDGPQTVAKGHEDQRDVAVAVAPKLAAAINFSTSCGVRYLRLRISAFGLRVGTF